jgi:hypothetical protein
VWSVKNKHYSSRFVRVILAVSGHANVSHSSFRVWAWLHSDLLFPVACLQPLLLHAKPFRKFSIQPQIQSS